MKHANSTWDKKRGRQRQRQRQRQHQHWRQQRSWWLEGLEQRLMLAGSPGRVVHPEVVRAADRAMPGAPINLPDLVVTSASAPANPKLGLPLTVSWTATNAGDAAVTGEQYDGVYLSEDNTFDPEDDSFLNLIERPVATVAPGGNYTGSAEVTIHSFSLEPAFLIVFVDVFQSQTESSENNNIFAIPIQPAIPDVDLTIVATAPEAAEVGQIDISWTVTNTGTDLATGWEVDRVYLSDDATLDGSDVRLTTYFRDGRELDAGASYTREVSVSLWSLGQKYLLFAVDNSDDQLEIDETNNVVAKPIVITGPDLTVTAGTVMPTQGRPGQSVNVSFTVKNLGDANADAEWSDGILLSEDNELDGDDVFLTNVAVGGDVPLAPDGSYTHSGAVTIPNTAPGDYFLLVHANYDGGLAEAQASGNLLAIPFHVDPPNVDIVIDAAAAPAVVAPGTSTRVSWEVTNTGTDPVMSPWFQDDVFLSNDAVLDPADRLMTNRYVGDRNRLAAGAKYQVAPFDLFIPSDELGNKYLLFVTDREGRQPETNEGNNVDAVPILIARPDLVVTAATAPAQANVNDSITINWTTKNAGAIEAPGNRDWYDVIVFSRDAILDDDDTWWDDQWHDNTPPLAANGQYSASLTTNVPEGSGGDTYILVVADGWEELTEGNEANNYFAIPIHVDGPDLTVSNVTLEPTSGTAGGLFRVTWTVNSTGTQTATSRNGNPWLDQIYVSDDAVFDNNDYFVANVTTTTSSLAVGGSYTLQSDVTLPAVAGGAKYVLVVTERSRQVREAREDNNAGAAAVTLAVPDLIVSAATVPAQASVNGQVPISITVTNTSADVAALGRWNEHVYLSRDQVVDGSDSAYGFSRSGNDPLAPGASYTTTGNFPLPNNAGPGQWYLLIRADGSSGQAESDETNNLRVVPIALVAPDLIVTSVVAPTDAIANSEIEVTWTVKNDSPYEAPGDWRDAIYIASQPHLGGARQLLVVIPMYDRTPLAPGAEYTVSQRVTIPGNWQGSRYILVQTDYPEFNFNFQIESNEGNNLRAAAIEIVSPDLSVTAASAPSSAAIGQTVNVSWTVRNGGTTPAPADWLDSIYVSDNATLDASDTLVRNISAADHTPLAVGASYSFTDFAIQIPKTGTGSRFLLFVADGGNGQGETNETNNVRSVAITLTAPDLSVSAAEVTGGSATPGGTLDLSWTVSNAGPADAHADWSDAVYFSSDDTFQATDPRLLIESMGAQSPLASNGSYTVARGVTVPASATPGTYYLLIRTDAADDQGETNEVNNFRAVQIVVGSPDLVLENVTAPASAAVGSAIPLSWTVANRGTSPAFADWTDAVYLSDDQTLGAGDVQLHASTVQSQTPLAVDGTYTLSPVVDIPSTARGARYLIFVSDWGGAQVEGNEANNTVVRPITLSAAELSVTSIAAPAEGVSGQQIQVSWTVTNVGDAPAAGPWSDQVYLSSDVNAGGDTSLGSFSFPGTLAPGQSITRTQNITLPANIGGARWIVVTADAGNALVEFPEDGNTAVDDQSMNVILAPAPNLRVTQVTVPQTAFSGQDVQIQWTVRNSGTGATSAPSWNDSVYLSLDTSLDGTDLHLGSAGNVSYLGAGDSYVNSLTARLPKGISGNYYFIVRTDGGNNVEEFDNEGDNGLTGGPTAVQLTPPPDLQVAANAPNLAFSGQNLTLSWTVTNFGPGATVENSWSDAVFMSSDNVIDPGDRHLDTLTHNGVLAVNGQYTITRTVKLPVAVTGNFFFIVRTDLGNSVYEHALDQNNDDDDGATNVLLTPPPDLEVSVVDAPANGLASHAFTFNYQVTNAGSSVTDKEDWLDAFYLSADTTFDVATDRLLGSRSHHGALEAGESYGGPTTFTLPNGLEGTFYLFVLTDTREDVFELERGNNRAHDPSPIAVVSRPAELVPAVSASATVEAGNALRVNWTVTNNGVGDTAVTHWTDRLFITGYPFPLQSFDRIGLLGPGASYSRSELIPIPFAVPPGQQTITLVTDYFNGVYETNDANNAADVQVTVTRREPDLQITGFSAPATAASGTRPSLNWSIRNAGNRQTNSHYWYDDAYLSDGVPGGFSLYLGRAFHGAALDPGESSPAGIAPLIPIDLAGDFFVVIHTDTTDTVLEDDGEGNNTFVSASPITITLSPTADLRVSQIDVPATGVSGQNVQFGWSVRNHGAAGASGSWYDAVYLSRDQVFDRAADLYLGHAFQGAVGPNGTYDKSASFEVPSGHTGPFYVIVAADGADAVYERGAEGNNVGVTKTLLQINLAPPSDLVVGTITVPINGTPGQDASITYTVNNNGANPAVGNWFDSLYISQDDQWDIGDALFGRFEHRGDVAPGTGYTHTLTAPLPGVLPGNYHVIVRTDIRNHIPEGSEVNNIGGSLDRVLIDAEQLALGIADTGTLGTGQSVYYRVDVPAGETLLVTFDGANAAAGAELYARYANVPSRSEFDFAFSKPFSSDQEVVVPLTRAGTYYVLAYGAGGASQPADYSITARLLPFEVRSIDPVDAGNTGPVTLRIHGARFGPSTSFKLVSPLGAQLNATKVVVTDASTAYATFDLTNRTAGAYDLVATGPAGNDSLSDALQVRKGGGADVEAIINGPAALRLGGSYLLSLDYTNHGGGDSPAPLLILRSPSHTPFGLDREHLDDHDVHVLATGPAFAGLLRPGERGSIPVYFDSPGGAGGTVNFELVTVTASDTTPMDWDVVEPFARPGGFSDTQWAPVWSALKASVGNTWGDYVRMLAANATQLSRGTVDPREPVHAVHLQVRKIIASLGPSISGTATANDLAVDLSNRYVTARNLSTGQKFVTTSLEDGSFTLETVSPGQYELEFDGAKILSGGGVTVGNSAATGIQLSLAPGARVSGLVRSTRLIRGIPQTIDGATVTAIAADGRMFVTTSDAGGNYVLSGLNPGAYTLLAEAIGYARVRIANVTLTESGIARVFDLAPEAVITGRVTYGIGGPSDGQLAVSARPVGSSDPTEIYAATYGEGSSFTIANLPPGDYRLTFTRPGYVTQTQTRTLTQGQSLDVGAVILPRGATISGTVTSAIPGTAGGFALVNVYQGQSLVTTVQSDEAGVFQVIGLQGGSYRLRVISITGFGSESVVNAPASTDVSGVALRIAPGGSITGTVLNDATSAPVAGATVQLVGPGGAYQRLLTGADGKYMFSGLALGTYRIWAPLSVGAPLQVAVLSLEGPAVLADLRIGFTTSLSGRLMRGDGTPVSGAIQVYRNGGLVGTVETDTGGTYRLLLAGGGTFDLYAGSDSASFAPVPGVSITDGTSIQRDITSGTGAANFTITAQGQVPLANADVHLIYHPAPGITQTAGILTTGANGVVTFPNLAPGEYSVQVNAPGSLSASATFTLASGQTYSSTLTAATGAQLAGRITGPTGQPLASARLLLASTTDPSLQYVTVTAADGTYAYRNLAPGTYDLIVLADGHQRAIRANVTPSAQGVDVQLTANNREITGRLVDRAGHPLLQGWVDVIDAQGRLIGTAAIVPDGSFAITTAFGSGLRLEVTATGFESLEQAGLDLQGGSLPLGNLVMAAYGEATPAPGPASAPTASDRLSAAVDETLRQMSPAGPVSGSGLQTGWLNNLIPQYHVRDDQLSVADIPSLPPHCLDDCGPLKAHVFVLYNQQWDLFELVSMRGETVKEYAYQFVGIAGLELLQAAGSIAAVVVLGAEITGAAAGIGGLMVAYKALGIVKGLAEVAINLKNALTAPDAESAMDIFEKVRKNQLTLADAIDSFSDALEAIEEGSGFIGENLGRVFDVLSLIGTIKEAIKNLTFPQTRNAWELYKQSKQDFEAAVDRYEQCVAQAHLANNRLKQCILNCDPDKEPNPNPPSNPNQPQPGGPAYPYNPPVLVSSDPNDILNPKGFGDQQWVRANQPLAYTIRFENEPSATAPAQEVVITQQLDPDLDWRTFRVDDVGWGDLRFEIDPTQGFYHQRHDLTQSHGFFVDVTVTIDVSTGLATWILTTIDPLTGDKPAAADIGFLPVNDPATHVGEGFVSYSVRPRADVVSGAVIDAQVRIVFDINEPIDTPAVFNAIDPAPPASAVTALLPHTATTDFLVSWSGEDLSTGSAVADYTVYVSVNGGQFVPWLVNTQLTQATYTALPDLRYAFYSVARDNVGNVEPAPADPDAQTIVQGVPPAVTAASVDAGAPIFVGPVKYVVIRFSEDVSDSLSLEDVKVRNLTTGQDVAPASLVYDAATHSAIIQFASATLPDGNYTLTVRSAGVSDVAGNLLDGDGDGAAGGDLVLSFFELAGDVDRDRDVDQADRQAVLSTLGTAGLRPQDGDATGDHNVDFSDLAALAQNYNIKQSGATLADGDFTGDGKVDFADLALMAQNYNRSGPPDLDRDGVVDQDDLNAVEANFGKTLPPPPLPAAPEPAAAAMPEALTPVALSPAPSVTAALPARPKPVARPAPAPKFRAAPPVTGATPTKVTPVTRGVVSTAATRPTFSTLRIRPSAPPARKSVL